MDVLLIVLDLASAVELAGDHVVDEDLEHDLNYVELYLETLLVKAIG